MWHTFWSSLEIKL